MRKTEFTTTAIISPFFRNVYRIQNYEETLNHLSILAVDENGNIIEDSNLYLLNYISKLKVTETHNADSYKSFDFNNSDSITISSLDGKISKTVTGEDKAFIEKLCSVKNAYSGDLETPACFFDTVKISIIKDKTEYSIYPSVDSCKNFYITFGKKKYYHHIDGRFKKFKMLLEKYGIEWRQE